MKREDRQARMFLMANAGLRWRIERALPPAVMWKMCQNLSGHGDLTETEVALYAGMMEPLRVASIAPFKVAAGEGKPIPKATVNAALQVAIWAGTTALGVRDKERLVATAMYAIVYWSNAMLTAGYPNIPEDGFYTATEKFVEELNAVSEGSDAHIIEAANRAGFKLARKMQERLEGMGLFVGAWSGVEAA